MKFKINDRTGVHYILGIQSFLRIEVSLVTLLMTTV